MAIFPPQEGRIALSLKLSPLEEGNATVEPILEDPSEVTVR